MLQNRKLSFDFTKIIESATNLCIYRLNNQPLSPNIFFPNAKMITLINCNKDGILNILNPNIVPNIKRINYLSAHPGDYSIYERFPTGVEWIFPNKNYDFYDMMVDNGRGKKDSDLIKTYIHSKKIIDGKNSFDISYEFDLAVPGMGIVNGTLWATQMQYYLEYKNAQIKNKNKNKPNQEIEEQLLEKERVKSVIEDDYFNYMIKSSNEMK
jgi:hypothetical protein